ncbi:Glucosyl-3-phosphoglycerate phosphatase [Corynebacterium urogenitale]|uniref:Glucosyl-3-phosphoglycerate phosphatase n=1 Tax=Corynebacterium urogenitale TaxID=2487892 RepID=A0A5J6ZAN6_9CORY|nr:histidine phosphatase family protein [Corynebacterium urogenitale]QFQ02000.1 Glucosyl-3-phosphoglycerate phosphatase [Corynebacterium urogenitale]
MMRRLVLVRHGQTEYNKTGRMQGQLDTELSEAGFAEARSVAKQIAEWNVSAVYSSDLKRAVDTAGILAQSWGLDVITDQRLRETDLGVWTGASHTEVDQDYPGQRAYWRHDPTWAPPKAETRLEVAERAHSLVNELMETDVFDRGMVVMVAHGGTIGALTAQLLNLPVSHFSMFSGLGNVRWSQLVARQKFVSAGGRTSDPAIDGSTVPVVPRKDENWWRDPHWHLEGWNMSVAPGTAPVQTASPDEGGEDTPE